MKDVRMVQTCRILLHYYMRTGLFNVFILFSVFRQRGRLCLSTPMGLLTHFSQEEPFDLSQKPPGIPGLRLSQSDGESIPGSSCQEEDEESLYRRSQYSPEVVQHGQAGEDQYIPELEERAQGSPQEAGETQNHEKFQEKLEEEEEEEEEDEEACDRESATEGQSVDPRDRLVHPYKSELAEQVYRQSYDYDSVSEPEDHQDELDERDLNCEATGVADIK